VIDGMDSLYRRCVLVINLSSTSVFFWMLFVNLYECVSNTEASFFFFDAFPDLTLWCLIKAKYFSLRGDVPVDSETLVVTSSISRPAGSVLQRSLLEVLIGVSVCAYV
jgi:hypothetical protein